MEIINRTKMPAELYVASDKDTRDHYIIVVKGTFYVGRGQKAHLAEDQLPFKYADEHYGDPANTSIRYPCDFVLTKPAADVLLNGHAYAPSGMPAPYVDVTLQVDSLSKRVRVFGDRHWQARWFGIRASHPEPFSRMPLLYERAFGGTDDSHSDPEKHGVEMRNLVGIGYHINPDSQSIVNTPLPNLEDPRVSIRKWKQKPEPVGFGSLGRGWKPRIDHAGTYDQEWLDSRAPFMPLDFDTQYFQSAPSDQQLPYLKGGENVRCTNVTPDGDWQFQVPRIQFAVAFAFAQYHVELNPNLDTVLLEPDDGRIVLTWRAGTPVKGKLHDLRRVFVGRPTPAQRRALEQNKPYFRSLADYMRWRERRMLAR